MLSLYHIIAFSMGFLLDFIIGDPYWMPHPVRAIGSLINWLDKVLMDRIINSGSRNPGKEKVRGIFCVVTVLITVLSVTAAAVFFAYRINNIVGIIAEAILTCYCLAAKSLKTESMKVYKAISEDDIEGARRAVSMIVGRDTDSLDDKGIIRAAVETVAENTSDGVTAPMIFLIIGGPILGLSYKAINTMDSMIAYHNDRYENFGKCAAKLDDIANFLPSRISAWLMITASYIADDFDGKEAKRIYKRDRFNHKSPNSAQTESVCAGALRVRLAGDAWYFGKLTKKPFIGEPYREIENEDIRRSCKLMYMTMALLILAGEIIMALSCLLMIG